MRTVVVFPAPFGPRNPNTSPEATVRSISRTASIPPLKRHPNDAVKRTERRLGGLRSRARTVGVVERSNGTPQIVVWSDYI